MLALLMATLALSYETDQLTDREQPLQDAREQVNGHLNTLLSQAIERTNTRTHCRADDGQIHKAFARQISRKTSRPAWVFKRGLFRAPGFTTYSAWVERQDDIDKREWRDRDDVFGDMTLWESVILTMAGPSSTIAINGHVVGTDKLDHFLNFGYIGWRLSRAGAEPERATAFSLRTERRFFGLITSKTYSYGDIAANGDGYRFYSGLLTDEGHFSRDSVGCLTQTRDFDWGTVVNWRYDEALNPPIFTPLVQRKVTRKIQREPERYCIAWEALGGPDYDAHIAKVLASEETPVPKRFDTRIDPFGLPELCADRAPRESDP